MKFRLVENINNKTKEEIDKMTEKELVKEFIIGLSTDDILRDGGGIVSSTLKKGATFILPDGKYYYYNDSQGDVHDGILASILTSIVEKKTGVVIDIKYLYDAGGDLMFNYLIDELGWIKANTGLGSVDNRCYFVVPHRDGKRPTNLQYYTIEEMLESAEKLGKDRVVVFAGMDGNAHVYFLEEKTPDEIVDSIRGYYSSSAFLESKQLNEIYPNKGESKKDFISRFMSVTKDEYPDRKQRFAVANSYWNRRNRKRVNEEVDKSTINDEIAWI